jgi:hypothetical protein
MDSLTLLYPRCLLLRSNTGPFCSLCIFCSFSFLAILGSCQLQSSTMNLVSDSSGPLCAADHATTVFTARSLIDCQRLCSAHKTKCYGANFYSDTKTCEVNNFNPTNFTSSRKNCQLYAVKTAFVRRKQTFFRTCPTFKQLS